MQGSSKLEEWAKRRVSYRLLVLMADFGLLDLQRFLEAFAREVEIRRSILAIVKDQAPNLAEKLQLSLTRLESTPERMEQASLADHMQAKRPAGQGDAEAPFASSDAQISIEAKAFRSLVVSRMDRQMLHDGCPLTTTRRS